MRGRAQERRAIDHRSQAAFAKITKATERLKEVENGLVDIAAASELNVAQKEWDAAHREFSAAVADYSRVS